MLCLISSSRRFSWVRVHLSAFRSSHLKTNIQALLHLYMGYRGSLPFSPWHVPHHSLYLTIYTCSCPLPLSTTTHCVSEPRSQASFFFFFYFAALPLCFSLPVFPAALFVVCVSSDLACLKPTTAPEPLQSGTSCQHQDWFDQIILMSVCSGANPRCPRLNQL